MLRYATVGREWLTSTPLKFTTGNQQGGQMEGEGQDTINTQPLLRVKIAEGMDQFEAEGAESMVTHLLNQWRERTDVLRAEAVSQMDRMMEQRGMGTAAQRVRVPN